MSPIRTDLHILLSTLDLRAVVLAGFGMGTGEVARYLAVQVGGGYGDYPAQAAAALQLAARTEGLVLDPVYTARALAGLAAAVRDGQVAAGQQTVFVHTGGLPGLFGHAAAIEQARRGLEQFPLDME